MARAAIGNGLAAGAGETRRNNGNEVRWAGVFELINLGNQWFGLRAFHGDTGNFGLGILLQPEAVVVQHGFENVLRGHILQADGHRRQFRFAIRAEFCHARIKDNIQVGLACQGFDDVHQRGVLE